MIQTREELSSIWNYSQTCLKETAQGTPKMWYLKEGGFLTQVNYREKRTFGGLKGLSLKTGGI